MNKILTASVISFMLVGTNAQAGPIQDVWDDIKTKNIISLSNGEEKRLERDIQFVHDSCGEGTPCDVNDWDNWVMGSDLFEQFDMIFISAINKHNGPRLPTHKKYIDPSIIHTTILPHIANWACDNGRDCSITKVPEPQSVLLMAMGLLGLFTARVLGKRK